MLPNELTNIMNARRESALGEAAERKRAAFAALPRLAEIEKERMETAFNLGIALVSGKDKESARKDAAEKLDALRFEQAKLLADNGLPPDYLEAKFTCPICSDRGVLDDGSLCRCAREKLMGLKYASSGLSQGARFELFSTSIYKDDAQRLRSVKAKGFAEIYASELGINGAPGLLLMGGTGLGKTFLMDCIGRRALENGRSVEKLTSYNMIERALASVRERTPARDYARPELLLIDDLGTEPMIPSITFETLFTAINERQNAGRAMVIATNLNRDEIFEQYGERIFSRLFAERYMNVIELKGEDLRL